MKGWQDLLGASTWPPGDVDVWVKMENEESKRGRLVVKKGVPAWVLNGSSQLQSVRKTKWIAIDEHRS